MNDVAKKVGKKIKIFRIEFEMTQEELAKEYGCQQRTLSDWESGNRLAPSSLLYFLSKKYGVSLGFFDVCCKEKVCV